MQILQFERKEICCQYADSVSDSKEKSPGLLISFRSSKPISCLLTFKGELAVGAKRQEQRIRRIDNSRLAVPRVFIR